MNLFKRGIPCCILAGDIEASPGTWRILAVYHCMTSMEEIVKNV